MGKKRNKEPAAVPEPAPEEDLAVVIGRISESLSRLLKSGIQRKTVIILVSHDTGIGQKVVSKVLDSLETLAETHTRKPT